MRTLLFLVLSVFLSACATKPSEVPAGPSGYRQGFADGCDSGYVAAGHPYYRWHKDVMRAKSDQDYAMGWQDGFTTCKGQYEAIQRL